MKEKAVVREREKERKSGEREKENHFENGDKREREGEKEKKRKTSRELHINPRLVVVANTTMIHVNDNPACRFIVLLAASTEAIT